MRNDPASVHDRPRRGLLEHRPAHLSDAEVLAVALRHGVRGASAMALARELLARFGSLRGVLDAPSSEICAVPGLGEGRFTALRASLEIARRYLEDKLVRGPVFLTPEDTRSFLVLKLQARSHEVFACLFLDNRHRLIRFEEMFRGTIDGASVHVREVAATALRLNAAALIVAHNHPSGVGEPSAADRAVTRRLSEGLSLLDIRLLDHFIVGDNGATSLASLGLL